MNKKITVDGKTKVVKLRDKSILDIQLANRPAVYKNKKKYTRKQKHKNKNWEEY